MSVRRLSDAFYLNGHSLYLVGGYVRDRLLGVDSKDIDFTTDAPPDIIKRILNGVDGVKDIYSVGEKFGTIGCKIGTLEIEITTYRTEVYDEGNRKPKVVFGESLEEDLARRDFTMNAMAINTRDTRDSVDPFGGKADIDNKLVRAVGNPDERFTDDPLRMLRAVRFAAKYGFAVEGETAESIKRNRYMLTAISAERIRDELDKMLMGNSPTHAFRMLAMFELLHVILPELQATMDVSQEGPYHRGQTVFNHTMNVVEGVPPVHHLRWAALLHDLGKADTKTMSEDGIAHFYGHELDSAFKANNICKRLRFPNELTRQVVFLVRQHMRPHALMRNDYGEKAVRRFILESTLEDIVGVDDLLTLNAADLSSRNGDLDRWALLVDNVKQVQNRVDVPNVESPLSGDMLMAIFNLQPGPTVGALKTYLRELVIDGVLEEGDQVHAVNLAKEWFYDAYDDRE